MALTPRSILDTAVEQGKRVVGIARRSGRDDAAATGTPGPAQPGGGTAPPVASQSTRDSVSEAAKSPPAKVEPSGSADAEPVERASAPSGTARAEDAEKTTPRSRPGAGERTAAKEAAAGSADEVGDAAKP